MGGPDGPFHPASVVSTSWRSTAALWRPTLRAVILTALLATLRTAACIARLLPTRWTATRIARLLPTWWTATRIIRLLPTRWTTARVARLLTTRWPTASIARLLPAWWTSASIARLLPARWTSACIIRWPTAWRPTTGIPGRPSGTGSRRWRRRMMRPAGLLPVPRPALIIIAPVSTDRERHDRQADHRAVAHHRHIAALIGIAESRRIDPTAQVRCGDVTPLVVADATHHANRDTTRQLRYNGIIRSRPGAHVDRAVRIGLRLCGRHCWQRQQAGRHLHVSNEVLFHFISRFLRPAFACVPLRLACVPACMHV